MQWPAAGASQSLSTAGQHVSLGRPVDSEAFTAALTAAWVDEFVGTLPDGLDTSLAGGWWGGHSISGGQWQRVAVARAYLTPDAPVLIADEPTSSLDPLAELAALNHLIKLSAGRTVLLVTHRLGICPKADWIVVLDRGQAVEQGTHSELLLANSTYAAMWSAQAEAYTYAAR